MRPHTAPTCALLAASVLLGACATTAPAPAERVQLGGQTVTLADLTAAEVARAVVVTTRDGRTIYRAPLLSKVKEIDLRRGGPGLAMNLGTVDVGRMGLLFGVRDGTSAPVRHFAAFQSDFVEGTNRFARVTLTDGTALPIRTRKNNRVACEPTCYLVFETLIVELPGAALRAAAASGLTLTVTLDNGTSFPVSAPPAYVQGYLQAVDGAR